MQQCFFLSITEGRKILNHKYANHRTYILFSCNEIVYNYSIKDVIIKRKSQENGESFSILLKKLGTSNLIYSKIKS